MSSGHDPLTDSRSGDTPVPLACGDVQTLCRLNRDRRSQSDLAVLDFINDADDIADAFHPYTAPSAPPAGPVRFEEGVEEIKLARDLVGRDSVAAARASG
ncbi:hypothetical protein ACFQZ8_01315 [Micromonospora azadirachtae]|uniref:Uncharacterized protein n=1 Tax=Micromonospora azadirachtae TaxID=1970735 RepID=A0ABW2ZVC9_9ACTN